jgi:hypothetical protein
MELEEKLLQYDYCNDMQDGSALSERLESIAGRLCEVLFPIKHEYYIGDKEKECSYLHTFKYRSVITISKATNTMSRILLVGSCYQKTRELIH